MASNVSSAKIDTIVALCKRRGFVFASGEIYGGTRSAWDYGPLGVELKENIKRQWWRAVVTSRDDVVGLDSSVILPRQVWVASGHVGVFTDPLTECQSCHKRFRADHLEEDFEARKGRAPENGLADISCPNCGTKGAWTEPRDFNMMLKTYLGPVEDESGLHYLRPETAQGIFVNFANVMGAARKKPPFGIGQIGKSFRNEITPGNFIFRTREFEQMEMEFFVEPGTDEQWHQYWIDHRKAWYVDLGLAEGLPLLRWPFATGAPARGGLAAAACRRPAAATRRATPAGARRASGRGPVPARRRRSGTTAYPPPARERCSPPSPTPTPGLSGGRPWRSRSRSAGADRPEKGESSPA